MMKRAPEPASQRVEVYGGTHSSARLCVKQAAVLASPFVQELAHR
jgi:hypothetical protein